MNLDFLTSMLMPLVVVACLAVGYVIKQWTPADNRIIPTVVFVLGCILGCVVNKDIELQSIVAGGVSGLASTGFYEAFAQWIKTGKISATDDAEDDTETRDEIESKESSVTDAEKAQAATEIVAETATAETAETTAETATAESEVK